MTDPDPQPACPKSGWKVVAGIIAYLLSTAAIYLFILKFIHHDSSYGYRIFFLRKDILLETRWLHLALAAACGLAIIHVAARCGKHGRWVTVSLILLLALIFNLLVHRPTEYSWGIRLVSNLTPIINPFCLKGVTMEDPSGYPGRHLEVARRGYEKASMEECRLTTYPPGLPLLYHGISRGIGGIPGLEDVLCRLAKSPLTELTEVGGFDLPLGHRRLVATAYAAVLLSLVAYLLLLLVGYLLACQVAGHERAVFALCLLVFIPSAQMFSNTSEMFFPWLGLATLYVLIRGIAAKNPALIALSGLVTMLSLFFTFAFLPVLALSLAIIGLDSLAKDRPGRTAMVASEAWLAGFAVGFSLLLALGYNSWEMCRIALGNNRTFYHMYQRSYLISLPLNFMELIYFTGLFMVPALACLAWTTLRRKLGAGRRAWLVEITQAEILCLALVATLSALLLSGGARGEIGRNWLIYFPLMAISAGTVFEGTPQARRYAAMAMLAVLLVISTITEVTLCFWI